MVYSAFFVNFSLMSERYSRRGILRASVATATSMGVIGGAQAHTQTSDLPDDLQVEQLPPLEIDNIALPTQTGGLGNISESAAGIRPGSQLFIQNPNNGGLVEGCTANFIWKDSDEGTQYIGAAGHCFLPTDQDQGGTDTDDDDIPVNGDDGGVWICTDCTFGGQLGLNNFTPDTASYAELGDVVFARQANTDGVGVGEDFGIVEIPPSDDEDSEDDIIDPSIPRWGGPDSEMEGPPADGEQVNLFGAGIVNGEIYLTQGRTGVALGVLGGDGSWQAAIRATPGDSGAPLIGADTSLLGASGQPAAGILSHVTNIGIAGTTIPRCKSLAEEHAGLDLELVAPTGG